MSPISAPNLFSLQCTFHRQGLRVLATAHKLSKLQHLKGLGMEVVEIDVVDAASPKRAVEQVSESTRGTLDILVNNAGAGYSMPLLDAGLDGVSQLFELERLLPTRHSSKLK